MKPRVSRATPVARREHDEGAELGRARFDQLCARVIEALQRDLRIKASLLGMYRSPLKPTGVTAEAVEHQRRGVIEEYTKIFNETYAWREYRRRRALPRDVRNQAAATAARYLQGEFDPLAPVIRRAQEVARGLPLKETWNRFVLETVVPAVNAIDSTLRRCPVCGGEFPLSRKGRVYDKEKCSALHRMKGRAKAAGGRSRADHRRLLAERKRKAAEEKVEAELAKHFTTCTACSRGAGCTRREVLLARLHPQTDALSRGTVEYGEHMDGAVDALDGAAWPPPEDENP